MASALTMALAVAAGSAIGGTGRWLLVDLIDRRLESFLPWGTLFVNVLGSLIMGALAGLLITRNADPALKAFLLVGVLGGFTTFSAFSWQALELMLAGRSLQAIGYAVLSVVLCIFAAGLGLRIAQGL